MQLKINGKQQEILDLSSLEKVIKDKGLNPENIVVEYNTQIIPRKRWTEIILKQNDIIEIVSFVGGG